MWTRVEVVGVGDIDLGEILSDVGLMPDSHLSIKIINLTV